MLKPCSVSNINFQALPTVGWPFVFPLTNARGGLILPCLLSAVESLSHNTAMLQTPPHSTPSVSPALPLLVNRSTSAPQPSLKRSGWSHALIGPYHQHGQNGALLAQLRSTTNAQTNKQTNEDITLQKHAWNQGWRWPAKHRNRYVDM